MNWPEIISRIERENFSSFSQFKHNSNRVTLMNIIYALFPSSRAFIQNLIQQNLDVLDNHTEKTLLIYNICSVVIQNPKYYKSNYDFNHLWKSNDEASSLFKEIMQTGFQQLVQNKQFNLITLEQMNQAAQFKFKLLDIHSLIRQKYSPNNFQEQLYSPSKKLKTEQMTLDRQMKSLQFIKQKLDEHQLVIILGQFASGKNYLVGQINSDKIEIQVDSTVDFESLMGTYVCTDQLGVFNYQDGPVLIALKNGYNLIIKNIQEASDDLLLQLSKLQKSKSIEVQGSTLYAHKNFGIVGLFSYSPTETNSYQSGNAQTLTRFLRYFRQDCFINLQPYNQEEIISILQRCNPNVFQEPLTQMISNLVQDRLLTDYLKLVKRFQYHILQYFGDCNIGKLYLVEELRRKLFLESYEILNDQESIYQIFGLQQDQLPQVTSQYNPEIQIFEKEIITNKLGIINREAFVKKQTGIIPSQIVYTQYSNQIIEKILTCIINNESCLLVGDTGCGKTTLSQHVASLFSKKLHVFNLSEGSDAQDLVGGFRPLDLQVQVKRVYQKFIKHFALSANMQKNSDFLQKIQELQNRNTLKSNRLLVKAMIQTTEKLQGGNQWQKIKQNLQRLEKQLIMDQKMSFHFLTGNLIKAMKKGDWVLIDEINLANNELLQKLIPAIEGKPLLFYERGDQKAIEVHPHFRIIGCMNPGSDVGKKELPANIKSKFTIHHIPEMTNLNDLVIFIRGIHSQINAEVLANFYLNLRNQSQTTHYSLRNLSRALHYMKLYRLCPEVIYNGLALGFQGEFSDEFVKSIEEQFSIKVPRLKLSDLNHKFTENSVQIYGFSLERGPHKLSSPENVEFMVTDGNLQPLLTLLRAISGSGLPVLLEGPTSAGKTSLVNFVAQLIGQKCHRINNHQNTDIEEYIGQYTSVDGQIKFQEGLLVKALRDGDWVILDELNLARSEILEHLNRLLDDNQELFLAETQTVLKPHKRFRIFATQNPVTYAGRKMLSKAFRNRFIQIEVPDININDMDAIIKRRCIHVPPSHVQYMIQTYKEVNLYRSSEHLLMQRSGMITLRDLIKWGSRMQHSSPDNPKEALAMEGYCLLVEKLRDKNSIDQITSILEKIFNIKIDCTNYYETFVKEKIISQLPNLQIQWNSSFIKMAALTLKAVQNQEPVLLIGPAGVGKTTLASMLGQLLKIQTKTLVAHQYLEISDFVGALRPTRQGEAGVFSWQDGPLLECVKEGGIFLIDEINMCPESVLEGLNSVLEIPASLTVNERMYHPNNSFVILGAMNPSGDWGKKELTPALRSRFTEIYVQNPLSLSKNEIQLIMRNFFSEQLIVDKLSEIFFTFNNDFKYRMNLNELTYRDLINIQLIVYKLINRFQLSENQALIYSLDINILIGLKNTISSPFFDEISTYFYNLSKVDSVVDTNFQIPRDSQYIGQYPFQVPFVETPLSKSFCYEAKSQNIQNLIKAITVDNKPILIQGPQSSGKMASIELLASLRSVEVVMIVLDEHTDLQELIGMDQPDGNKFKFKNGPLLQGIIEGKWIILKNLNLAPQNVLEGMNSIFDHRQEIFVPEVNQTFKIHENCKIFGVQNPMSLGGGRKGLPASFLNRFVKVNYQDYDESDYRLIASQSLQMSSDVINQYHGKIYPCSLVAYMKFFRTLKLTQNEQLTFNLCFGANNDLAGNLFEKILTRDLTLMSDQRTQLLNLLLMQTFIQSSNIIGIYLKGSKGAGKKTLIQKLSKIYNKKIRYLNLSSTADSSDLIGKFEQFSKEGLTKLRQSEVKQRRKTLLNNCNNMRDLTKVLQDEIHIEIEQSESIFNWSESNLIKAIRNGDWLVIEDISYINPTLIPKLIPLLRCQRGQKIPLNTNDELHMSEQFQLFITDSQIDNYNVNLMYLQDYCYNLKLSTTLNTQDKEQIVRQSFSLLPLSQDIINPTHQISSKSELNDYIREAQLQLFQYGNQAEENQRQQNIYHPFYIQVPVSVSHNLKYNFDMQFAYLFKDLDNYEIHDISDLFTLNYIVKYIESLDLLQNTLQYVQNIVQASYQKGQIKLKEITSQVLEEFQEYYAKHYVKLPNILKSQLEIFIQGFNSNNLLKAHHLKQFFEDNLSLIFNLIGDNNPSVKVEDPHDWLSKKIKQTMPKTREQYYLQLILGCLAGIYNDTSNKFDINGLCHLIQYSHVVKCPISLIHFLSKDLQNNDFGLSLAKDHLKSYQKTISRLDQIQQKITIVSDNIYSNTTFMDGEILDILAHQVQERQVDEDSRLQFTDVYRLLEYGKGSRQNLFELVLYLFKTTVNSIELKCIQRSTDQRSIENLIYPQNVLFSDHLDFYEIEINNHILRQELGAIDVGNLVITLRNNLLTANISNLKSIIQMVDRVLKALSHDQYQNDNRIGKSVEQRAEEILWIYGLEYSINNLFNLFLSAASIFEQNNNELDLFKAINKEQISSEQIKFQLYELQQTNMFKAKAYNFITFFELEEPDQSKQLELQEQLKQYQSEIVLRGVSDDSFLLTEQFIFENYSFIQKLREAYQHQEHFVNLAKQWMMWCHKKYFQNFKDILVPLFYPLILIIESLETQMKQAPHVPENGFLPTIIKREPLNKISLLGKPIFFTDLQQSEDLLGRDKFKDYLLHELDALVKDEYTKPKEEPKAINIKEYITAELNELEIYSNELLKYFLSESKLYFLDLFLNDWNKHRSQMSYFLILGEIYGQNDTEFNAALLRNMHHQILDIDIPQEINVFKENSLILITQLTGYLRNLLEKINQYLGEDLFCENQMLIDLSICILNILEQPAFSSPIVKFTSMIEVLIDKIDQWDGCVPRSYHLKASCQEMIDLYIVFKQKEKSTWKYALQKRITDLWNVEAIVGLKLYEQILGIESIPELQKCLWSFLTSCSLGVFEIRYLIVKRLERELTNQEQRVAFEQVLYFASIFLQLYNTHAQQSMKEFESEFKEEMSLISWKSVNYVLLKQASEKMQQRISKMMKRISGYLEGKFSTKIMEQVSERLLINDFGSFTSSVYKQKTIKTLYQKPYLLPLKKSKVLQLTVVPRLKQNSVATWVIYERSLQEYQERMMELKKTDAKSNIKQRTLEEFFKYAESVIGIKTTSKQAFLDGIDLSKGFINISGVVQDQSLQNQITKSINLYYNTIHHIRVTLSKNKMTQSIPPNLLKKGIAILFNVQQAFYQTITSTLKIAQSYTNASKIMDHTDYEQAYNQLYLLECISNQLSNDQKQALRAKIQIIRNLKQSGKTDSKQWMELKNQIELLLNTLTTQQLQYDTYFEQSVTLKYLRQVSNSIPDQREYEQMVYETSDKLKKEIKLLRLLMKKYQSGITQSLDPEGDTTLMKTESKYLNTLQLFIKHYENEQQASQEYTDIIKLNVAVVVQNMRSSCKFFYFYSKVILNLYVNGFCSKEGEGKESGGTDFKDGTGMGEGKGQDNVTKEMEFEEQVLGEENQKKDEKEEEEEEVDKDDKNEMEMDNNFDGDNSKPNEESQPQEEQPEKNDLNDLTDSSVNDQEEQQQNNLDEEENDEKKSQGEQDERNDNLDYEDGEKDLQAKDNQDKGVSDNEQSQMEDEDAPEDQNDPDEKFSLPDDIENEEFDDDNQVEEENNENPEEEDNQMEKEQEDLEDHVSEVSQPDQEVEQAQQIEEEAPEEAEEGQEENERMEAQEKNQEKNDDQNEGQTGENPKEDGLKNDKKQKEQSQPNQMEQEDQEDNQQDQGQDQGNDQNQGQEEKVQQQNQEGEEPKPQKNVVQDIKNQTQMEEDDILQENPNLEQNETQQDETNNGKDANITESSKHVTKQATRFDQQNLRQKEQLDEQKQQTKQEKQVQQPQNQGGIEIEEDQNKQEEIQIEITNDKTEEKVEKIQVEVDYQKLIEEQPNLKIEQEILIDNSEQWEKLQHQIHSHAAILSEELKVVLTPQKCQALKGDYKTGKRLNMKKVIPFIASNYKKDKIWLRRTLPSKRTYQILIGLDNSLSMKENNVDNSAIQSLLSVALALQKMEVGQLAIWKIGQSSEVVKDFYQNQVDGRDLMNQFNFSAEGDQMLDMSILNFMVKSLDVFQQERSIRSSEQCDQLCFIISDGRLNKKVQFTIQSKVLHDLVKRAEQLSILYVFIIVDSKENDKSIFNIKSTNYVMKNGVRKLQINRYLEDFPFNHYIVIKDFNELNKPLVNIIRQYFQLNNE